MGRWYLLTHQRGSVSGKAWYPIWRPGWRRRTGGRGRSSWCDCERHSETSARVRESLPWFLYNKQNHLNYSVTTARKSLSPTDDQLRRVSVLYLARDNSWSNNWEQWTGLDLDLALPARLSICSSIICNIKSPPASQSVQSLVMLTDRLTLSQCNVNIITTSPDHYFSLQSFLLNGYLEMSVVCLFVAKWSLEWSVGVQRIVKLSSDNIKKENI